MLLSLLCGVAALVLAHRVSQMPLFTCVAHTKDFVGANDLLQTAVGSETLPNCTFLYFSLEKRHLNHSQHDAKYLQHLKCLQIHVASNNISNVLSHVE